MITVSLLPCGKPQIKPFNLCNLSNLRIDRITDASERVTVGRVRFPRSDPAEQLTSEEEKIRRLRRFLFNDHGVVDPWWEASITTILI
jgi:hypothetical protein